MLTFGVFFFGKSDPRRNQERSEAEREAGSGGVAVKQGGKQLLTPRPIQLDASKNGGGV